jgi:N-acetylglucosaminyldiphosphoundecaprenol N-acetyl-beta-D-mannosaminyltransferase
MPLKAVIEAEDELAAGATDHPSAAAPAPPSAQPLRPCNLLGVVISAINLPMAVQTIERWIARHQKKYVCVTGMHGVTECQTDEELKRIHNAAGMVTPDGMPMVWLNKLRGNRHVTRVYGPDLMHDVCAASVENGHKHFLYGGAEGVADLLAAKLKEKFPGLQIVGTCCPPFRKMTDEEDKNLVEMINASGADIVWVGLSTPKQERWMAAHRAKLDTPVLIGVGAAFDFHAGLKKQAPRWMQRGGLEWFFRMVTEPRRLGKRYLIGIPTFLGYLCMQALHMRDYHLADDDVEEWAQA